VDSSLDRFDREGDLHQLAGGFFRVGVWTVGCVFHFPWINDADAGVTAKAAKSHHFFQHEIAGAPNRRIVRVRLIGEGAR
jgi:hypothetical protein